MEATQLGNFSFHFSHIYQGKKVIKISFYLPSFEEFKMQNITAKEPMYLFSNSLSTYHSEFEIFFQRGQCAILSKDLIKLVTLTSVVW